MTTGVIIPVIGPVIADTVTPAIGDDDFGFRFTYAVTADLAGDACPTCITVTMSRCLTVGFLATFSPANYFRFFISPDGVAPPVLIAPLSIDPDPHEISAKQIQITFDGADIATARGSGDPFWMEGDVLTMNLDQAGADQLLISPDCQTIGTESPPPVRDFPVNNLYAAPTLLAARII